MSAFTAATCHVVGHFSGGVRHPESGRWLPFHESLITTDLRGYAGNNAWCSFYAVIYTTKNFCNQADVVDESLLKADLN